jgi:16S rRNA processing protein RimM
MRRKRRPDRSPRTGMETFDRDSLLLVGVCGPPHGVKGEVKVVPETDDPSRLLGLERVWLGTSAATARRMAVVSARFQTGKRGLTALLRIEGVDDRESADALRRQRVYALQDDLPPLAEDDIFLHDMLGLEVLVEEDGGATTPIGVVSDVIEGVAQDLLVVQRPGQPDALVPDVDEIVVNVDTRARTITLRPPEGLLD